MRELMPLWRAEARSTSAKLLEILVSEFLNTGGYALRGGISSMVLPPLTFTGVSTFSSDFQTILDRASNIAQIPVRQLQNKDSDVLQRKTLLSGLSGAITDLAASLKSLGTTAAGTAL